MQTRLIRIAEVQRITGLSRTTIWRRERAGDFPRRRRLGSNSVAWVLAEVIGWCHSREVIGNDAVTNELVDEAD